MPDVRNHADIAAAFLAARSAGAELTTYPGDQPRTLAEGYAIQSCALALDARIVGGWKVGRIPPGLVEQYGSERLVGPIFADEIVDGVANYMPAMPVYCRGFAAAEAELLLCLGEVGTHDHDLLSVRDCVTQVRVGIEIASSPFAGINECGPAVTISDYGNNKGLVLGPVIEDWRNVDLINILVETMIDGRTVGQSTMARMLDGPFGSAAFLIKTLRARGIAILPGTWVSTGAITGVHEVVPGQQVDALFNEDIRTSCTIGAV